MVLSESSLGYLLRFVKEYEDYLSELASFEEVRAASRAVSEEIARLSENRLLALMQKGHEPNSFCEFEPTRNE